MPNTHTVSLAQAQSSAQNVLAQRTKRWFSQFKNYKSLGLVFVQTANWIQVLLKFLQRSTTYQKFSFSAQTIRFSMKNGQIKTTERVEFKNSIGS